MQRIRVAVDRANTRGQRSVAVLAVLALTSCVASEQAGYSTATIASEGPYQTIDFDSIPGALEPCV